jgi:hypothetical protein
VLAILPVFLLLLAALAISLLGLFYPKFKYHWLIAFGGGVFTMISIWALRSTLPLTQSIGGGEVSILILPAFSLQIDEVTWPFALALVTLCLAVVMTDVGRAAETSWVVWAGDLGITSLGLFAVLAQNPMTLLIGWALVDVVELAILLRQIKRAETRQRVLYFFATSVLGSMFVLGAIISAGNQGLDLSFSTIPSQAQLFLVLAAGLRMGVFPLQVAFLKEVHHLRGQGTLLRLIPPATSMPLLVYAAFTPVSPAWRYPLLGLSVLAALYGGIGWARAQNELQGRIYWIISLAGMAFIGTMQFRPEAAQTWGLAMLYGGAALFLASVRTRWMVSLGIFSLLTISALPFMPTYSGLTLFEPFNIFVIFIPMAHAALLLGYLRHASRQSAPLKGVERWVHVIYPMGLILLPVTFLFSSMFSPDILGSISPPLWPLISTFVVAAAAAVFIWKKIKIPEQILNPMDKVFSLKWLYPLLGWLYRGVGWAAREVTLLIEGEGGVLWALVLLVLLVSILAQITSGVGAV